VRQRRSGNPPVRWVGWGKVARAYSVRTRERRTKAVNLKNVRRAARMKVGGGEWFSTVGEYRVVVCQNEGRHPRMHVPPTPYEQAG